MAVRHYADFMMDVAHKLTWEELCADPSLQDLPFRIELNGLNQIVMSPLHRRHGRYQGRIYHLLVSLLSGGEPSLETAVSTSDNIKVPDVIWATDEFFRLYGEVFAAPVAPDLCVEVLSPTNTKAEIDQKRALYFEAGACEVWLCGLKGGMEFYTPAGQIERSALCPEFPVQIELR